MKFQTNAQYKLDIQQVEVEGEEKAKQLFNIHKNELLFYLKTYD
jgi:hypothetical protein